MLEPVATPRAKASDARPTVPNGALTPVSAQTL